MLANQLAAEGKATYQRALALIALTCGAAVALGVGAAVIIARSITRQLGGEPSDVVQAASAIAGGDLSVNVPTRAGDTHSLVAAIGTMRDRLADVVGQVRLSSNSIATGSAQIAAGSADQLAVHRHQPGGRRRGPTRPGDAAELRAGRGECSSSREPEGAGGAAGGGGGGFQAAPATGPERRGPLLPGANGCVSTFPIC